MKINRKKTRAKGSKNITKKIFPESKEKVIAYVRESAESLCEVCGMELVHIEYPSNQGGGILRLYIDKPGGVSLDDCVYFSRRISDMMDKGPLADLAYNLEVSSPGLNRPLVKMADFERFKGEKANIKTSLTLEGRKNFSGILLGLSDGVVKILINNKTVVIPFQEITSARLIKECQL